MRDRKLSTCLLAILFFITTLTAFTQDISADIGPKPSIELHLENAPSDYFIVLLAPTQEAKTESPLRLDQVNEDSVAAYLETFNHEGWIYEEGLVGKNYKQSNEDQSYRWGYMVPSYFKVMVIASDGSVSISNEVERQEFNATFTYDVATGKLTENLANTIEKRWTKVAICFVLTLLIEFGIFLVFAFPKTKRNTISVVVANAITNISMTTYLLWFYDWNPRDKMSPIFLILVLEVYVFIVEMILYAILLKDKDGKKDISKNIKYALAANAASLLVGILIPYV